MCCVACCRLCVMRSRSARGRHTSSPGRFVRARPANDTGATGGCRGRCNYAGPWSRDRVSDAETHVNVLHQLLVGRLVLLQDVVVNAAARERRPEQETEEAASRLVSIGPRAGTGQEGRRTLRGTRRPACAPAARAPRARPGRAPSSGSCARRGRPGPTRWGASAGRMSGFETPLLRGWGYRNRRFGANWTVASCGG